MPKKTKTPLPEAPATGADPWESGLRKALTACRDAETNTNLRWHEGRPVCTGFIPFWLAGVDVLKALAARPMAHRFAYSANLLRIIAEKLEQVFALAADEEYGGLAKITDEGDAMSVHLRRIEQWLESLKDQPARIYDESPRKSAQLPNMSREQIKRMHPYLSWDDIAKLFDDPHFIPPPEPPKPVLGPIVALDKEIGERLAKLFAVAEEFADSAAEPVDDWADDTGRDESFQRAPASST